LDSKINIITPSPEKNRGCQLSLRMIDPIDHIMDTLYKNGVTADWREPDVIRVAPVPLYNTFHEVWEFSNILIDVL